MPLGISQRFFFKSIVLIVCFGKVNPKLGTTERALGFVNTERSQRGVGRRPSPAETAVVREQEDSSPQPQVAAVGEESFSRYKNVPDACGRHSCLLLLSGALGTSTPSRGKWGPRPTEELFPSERSDTKSKVSHAFAVWPWEGPPCPLCRLEGGAPAARRSGDDGDLAHRDRVAAGVDRP